MENKKLRTIVMEKINIAELLKDCPSGMELDCIMYDNATFEGILDDNRFPIKIQVPEGNILLSKYGCMSLNTHAKCVIFPKGKTTWEGFIPPCKFKDGDIVAAETDLGLQVFILQKAKSDYEGYCYIGYDFVFNDVFDAGEWVFDRLATEEEKQKLFTAIKKHGYKWNAETKTLERLIEPKFKVGDRIKKKGETSTYTITDVNDAHYFCGKYVICDTCDNNWELVPNKFDITTFKPFDKVLVRDCNSYEWEGEIFTRYAKSFNNCNFVTLGGESWKQCIPYNDNTKHLLGTTNNCDDFYKTWK